MWVYNCKAKKSKRGKSRGGVVSISGSDDIMYSSRDYV
jgi:hypothetical protein